MLCCGYIHIFMCIKSLKLNGGNCTTWNDKSHYYHFGGIWREKRSFIIWNYFLQWSIKRQCSFGHLFITNTVNHKKRVRGSGSSAVVLLYWSILLILFKVISMTLAKSHDCDLSCLNVVWYLPILPISFRATLKPSWRIWDRIYQSKTTDDISAIKQRKPKSYV